jgi:hypothetical protein
MTRSQITVKGVEEIDGMQRPALTSTTFDEPHNEVTTTTFLIGTYTHNDVLAVSTRQRRGGEVRTERMGSRGRVCIRESERVLRYQFPWPSEQ